MKFLLCFVIDQQWSLTVWLNNSQGICRYNFDIISHPVLDDTPVHHTKDAFESHGVYDKNKQWNIPLFHATLIFKPLIWLHFIGKSYFLVCRYSGTIHCHAASLTAISLKNQRSIYGKTITGFISCDHCL